MKKLLLLIIAFFNVLSFTSCVDNDSIPQGHDVKNQYASLKVFIEEYNKAHPDGYITNEKWCEVSGLTIAYPDKTLGPCIVETNGYMKFKFTSDSGFSGSSDYFYIERKRNNLRVQYRMGEFPSEYCLKNVMCLNNGKYIEQNTYVYSNVTTSGIDNIDSFNINFRATMYYSHQTDIFKLSTMLEHLESDWPNLSTYAGLQYITCNDNIIRMSVYKNGTATSELEIATYEYYFDEKYDLEKVVFTNSTLVKNEKSLKRHSYMVIKFSDELSQDMKEKISSKMLNEYTDELEQNSLSIVIQL